MARDDLAPDDGAHDERALDDGARDDGVRAGDITWLSTKAAAERLGVTPRTLYRFIDEGQLPGYRFGRVIRLQQADVDAFIATCRIEPGSLEHLYPEVNPVDSEV